MMTRIFIFTVIGLLLCFAGGAAAQDSTLVSGTIAGAVWTLGNSPYCVVGDLNIASLTIEPGVKVIFRDNYIFEVSGHVTAVGTERDSIIFDRAPASSGWRGVYFNHSAPGSELAYCRIEHSINHGITCIESQPIIRNCKIMNNSMSGGSSNSGGGFYITGSLTLSECILAGNAVFASNGYGSASAAGGGIYAKNGVLILDRCEIRNNGAYASGSWGTGRAYGGGIFTASDYGYECELRINNCIIDGNDTNGGGCPGGISWGEAYGSGIFVEDTLVVSNSIISHNTIYAYNGTAGGGLYIGSGVADLTNCTIAYNTNQGLYNSAAVVTTRNSIYYFNTGAQIAGTVSAAYCDVQGGLEGGEAIIDYNPVFLGNGELIIVIGSPCIDAGDPAAIYNDQCFPPSLGTERNDMGAHGGPGACNWPWGIACRPWPVSFQVCDWGELCLSLPIYNVDYVNVSAGATWSDNELCFNADAAGTYTFTVTAGNSRGTDECEVSVNVTTLAAPVACFTTEYGSISDDAYSVRFGNCSTPLHSFECAWDFGDGNTSADAEPEHAFASNSTFTVTLIASNACGSDTFVADVYPPTLLRFDPDTLHMVPSFVEATACVEIRIDNARRITGVQAELSFDPKRIEIVEMKPGDFLKAGGATISDLSSIDNENGSAIINLARVGGAPFTVSGNGSVLLLSARSIYGNPTSSIVFESASLQDSPGSGLPTKTSDCAIEGIFDLLGDFDKDMDVDFLDYTYFVSCWNAVPDDLDGDVASPITGEYPDAPPWSKSGYPYCCDGTIDETDQMAFSMMYNWSNSAFDQLCWIASRNTMIASSNPRDLAIEVAGQSAPGAERSVILRLDTDADVAGASVKLKYNRNAIVYNGCSFDDVALAEGSRIWKVAKEKGDLLVSSNTILGGGYLSRDGSIRMTLHFKILDVDDAVVEIESVDLRTVGNRPIPINPSSYRGIRNLGTSDISHVPSSTFALFQNSPNPFNPATTISFSLPERFRATLVIYDIRGRRVRTLADEVMGEGYQERIWDGRNEAGNAMSTGVYFYRLTAGGRTVTKKMVLLK